MDKIQKNLKQGRVPEKNGTEKKRGRISCRVNYTVELNAAPYGWILTQSLFLLVSVSALLARERIREQFVLKLTEHMAQTIILWTLLPSPRGPGVGNNQKPCFCQREMQHLVICYLSLVFFRYLLVISIKRKKNPEVATFTCGMNVAPLS